MFTQPPQRIDRYEVIRELGRSNAIVYEAWDERFHRRVAVKVLNAAAPSHAALDDAAKLRFRRELQANGAAVHPNVMQVFDVGEWHGYPYLVAEFLEGSPLSSALAQSGRFDLPRVQSVLGPVLSALAHVHRLGIVHRDLKPDNIMVLTDGTPKLIDFGIARVSAAPTMTATGAIFGTPHYMSPEQALGQTVDHRSDLYSMGVIAYALLSGHSPFARPSMGEVLAAVVNFDPPTLPHVDAATSAFLKKATAKSPAARYGSADEMRAALMALGAPPAAVRAAPAAQPVAAAPQGGQILLPKPVAVQAKNTVLFGHPVPWMRWWREGLILLLVAALVPMVKFGVMGLCLLAGLYLWFIRQKKFEAGALGCLFVLGFFWNPWGSANLETPSPPTTWKPVAATQEQSTESLANADEKPADVGAEPATATRREPEANRAEVAASEPSRKNGRAGETVRSDAEPERVAAKPPRPSLPKRDEAGKEPGTSNEPVAKVAKKSKPAESKPVAKNDPEADSPPSLRSGSRLGEAAGGSGEESGPSGGLRGGSRVGD